MLGGDVLGVQAIVAIAPGLGDSARLHTWLQTGLNEACLADRLHALYDSTELYATWYDRYCCSCKSWAYCSQINPCSYGREDTKVPFIQQGNLLRACLQLAPSAVVER